jgi:ornithine decarboxylase
LPHRLDDPPALFATTRHLPTPFLLVDPAEVRRNVAAVRAALPGVEVFYALKANPDPRIADAVAVAGAGFEVASPAEVRQLLAAGVTPDRLMCLHPVKAPGFLKLLQSAGVDWLAVDSPEEVEKVAEYAGGSRVLVRVTAASDGSRVCLAGKFGCPPADVVPLLAHARRLGLRPAGVTTHVGSQCESLDAWAALMRLLRRVCRDATAAGFPPEVVSLGGGLPVRYTPSVPALESIGRTITEFRPGGCRVTIEPGRAIAASAGTLVATVTGLSTRGGTAWAYLDAGVYHGAFETLPAAGGLRFPIEVGHPERPPAAYRLAGPTCDALDALPEPVVLPRLAVGDRVAFRLAGAYSTGMATAFNGFPTPAVVYVGELPPVVSEHAAVVR